MSMLAVAMATAALFAAGVTFVVAMATVAAHAPNCETTVSLADAVLAVWSNASCDSAVWTIADAIETIASGAPNTRA